MSEDKKKDKDKKIKFAGNYKGPLYAPHPDLLKNNERKTDNP